MSEELENQQPQSEEGTNPAEDTTAQDTKTTGESVDNTAPTTEPVQKETIDTEEKATELLESKGFDYDALTKEFQANGDLLPETRTKLEKQGITGEILDAYIEGQKAIIQRQMEDIATVVGGMDNMESIVEWAKTSLSDDEKRSIEAVHDPAVIKIILKDLEKRMNEDEGYVPPQQLQGGAGVSLDSYYESMAEVEEAINDPRYSKDPVYRAKVANKISASREAGVLEIK